MTRHIRMFPGLRPDSLMTYLASLGLSRVLAQKDPASTVHWENETLTVSTTIDDVVGFLVEEYTPTPVVNPWNGGSGYGPKDKNQKVALEALMSSNCARLRDYRETHQTVLEVLDRAGPAWKKEVLLQELRNWLPDRALEWMDSAVVLTAEKAVFPIILGTGGNDGRLEFSSNFHQRLADVLPELGAQVKASRGWAEDLLTGRSTQPLKAAAIGQYDPLGAGGPGTSAFDDTTSLVNPWAFVLMVEGATLFASSPARRIESSGSSRAAQPFTVNFSPDGPVQGAGDEAARGEVWAPTWARPLRHGQIRQVFAQAKASWDGRTVVQAPHMYAAVRSMGVDRRIDAFTRFAIVQRNGLAFVAVAIDRVSVASAPGIDVLIPIERRANAFRPGTSSRIGMLRRHYEAGLTAFARNADEASAPELLLQLLAAQTELELGCTRSGRAREQITKTPPLVESDLALEVLAPALQTETELRVAATLASGYYPVPTGPLRPLRALLVGLPPSSGKDEWVQPEIPGYSQRPLVDVLADAAVWLEQQANRGVRDYELAQGKVRGVRYLVSQRYRAQWGDAHAWAAGQLDDTRVEFALKALLSVRWESRRTREQHTNQDGKPQPDLALLQVPASGRYPAPGSSAAGNRQGMPRGWAVRLRAGQVSPVLAEAAALVNRLPLGSDDPVEQGSRYHFATPRATTAGPRLLAALLASPSWEAANKLDRRFPAPPSRTTPPGGEVA